MHNKSLSVNNEWGETKERRKTQRLQNSAKKNKTIFLNWKILTRTHLLAFSEPNRSLFVKVINPKKSFTSNKLSH